MSILERPEQTELKTKMTATAYVGGLVSLSLLVLSFLWMQYTLIAGAVIAPGQVVVRGKPKQVQSLDGGVVEAIFVEDGDIVKAGDILLQLDPSILEINLDIYRNRLADTVAREIRLRAEYQDLETPVFKSESTYLDGMPMQQHFSGQREIFIARRNVLSGRKEQLDERILQFDNQIDGVSALITSKHQQLEFIQRDLENVRSLNEDGLARESEVLALQRVESDLLGQIAEHQSGLARIRNSIRDTELETLQYGREFKEQVVTELREVTAQREELVLQIVTVKKQLERINLLSPTDGIIHEMKVFTVGGVVAQGTTIMQVVPISDGVEFELRVDPQAIDQVFIGQVAKVIFPAFNMRTTPELFGSVSSVSPSALTDPASGMRYFRIELLIPTEELAKLGEATLIPGMPVEAFLQTGERSVLTYLTKPLVDQLNRAFRDG